METKEIEIYIDGKLVSKDYDVEMFTNNFGDIVSFELKSKPERKAVITESEIFNYKQLINELFFAESWCKHKDHPQILKAEENIREFEEKLFSKGEE